MSLDPCVPLAPHIIAAHASRPLHRLSHHVGARHFRRLHHAHSGVATATTPAETCGKHFAAGQPGVLAARPTDGAPLLAPAGGKAVGAKLAAGGVGSLLAAATVVGALAMPAGGFGGGGAGLTSRGGGSGLVSGAVPGGGISTPAGGSPYGPGVSVLTPLSPPPATPAVVGLPTGGAIGTPVPEPSSLALLGGFASVIVAIQLFRKRALLW